MALARMPGKAGRYGVLPGTKKPGISAGLDSGYISDCLNLVICTIAIFKILVTQVIHTFTKQPCVVVPVDA